jgi:CRP-like cAMP-binding protein
MSIKLQLHSVPVFQFVSQEQVITLGGVAKAIEKGRSEAFLLAGETVPGIYVVAEGRVGVYPPGTTRPLVTLGTGESFGEMSFLEKSKASATIRAEESGTKVAVLLQTDLAHICEQDPELGRALYHGMALTLSSKLRTTTEKIARELQVGRKLLQDLAREDHTPHDLTGLAAEVVKANDQVIGTLDASVKIVENVSRKVPEKAGTLGDLELKLSDVKHRCQDFYPRLARQIAAITNFVKSMEEFILHSTRD